MGLPLTVTVPVTLASAVDDSTGGAPSLQPHAATERAVAATRGTHHPKTRMVTSIGSGRARDGIPGAGSSRTPSGPRSPPNRRHGGGAGRGTRREPGFGGAVGDRRGTFQSGRG